MGVNVDPNWLNAAIAFCTFVTLILSLLIGYLFRLSKELGEHKTHVAETYATKDDVKELGDRIERSMVKEFDRIHALLQGRDAA
ncbi:hypothetical protein [Vibrio nigripulchritudo]|uniref:hypothetical protein n=1 Tax=Vibrio nigripulchritudo TaxID=28173 RepID=UPI0024907EFD|nr:hypothetical protein [Vibrio nigripulchritudo]BDU38742.1 hypothetical protein TUMSATVNIG2_32110 [Vibrio nigripulchritudo]BDU44462.1 hypothetical protein TUMSATVNIG3_32600 [Vibrio nigripulchritudo]